MVVNITLSVISPHLQVPACLGAGAQGQANGGVKSSGFDP
jgi:hypothetical protein